MLLYIKARPAGQTPSVVWKDWAFAETKEIRIHANSLIVIRFFTAQTPTKKSPEQGHAATEKMEGCRRILAKDVMAVSI